MTHLYKAFPCYHLYCALSLYIFIFSLCSKCYIEVHPTCCLCLIPSLQPCTLTRISLTEIERGRKRCPNTLIWWLSIVSVEHRFQNQRIKFCLGICNVYSFASNSINNLLQLSNAAYKWILHWAPSKFVSTLKWSALFLTQTEYYQFIMPPSHSNI